MPRSALLFAVAIALPPAATAQVVDSAARLPDLTVSVTRERDSLARVGAAITVVDRRGVARGRVATGLDEALAFVPGVIVGNRWNYSLDQRLSIRGFGSRANFGLRGVKVLLDGVPQTLPDGQSQLTNLDLALVDRVEVLRGAASSLHGNAAGGVIAFRTQAMPDGPHELTGRTEVGSFGTSRVQLVGAARRDNIGGTIAVSRFATDGSRMHSAAEQRRVTGALDWSMTPSLTATLRVAHADDPQAQNPGALTLAELGARRDTAAANNLLRGADKAVSQTQLAAGLRGTHRSASWDVTLFGLQRDLDNPLATPPPMPQSSAEGTFVGIGRRVGGIRASAHVALNDASRPIALTGGIDAQSMRDDRVNRRALDGVPGTDVLLDQRETVREIGTFLQLDVPVGERMGVRAGARHDFVRFGVRDRKLDDGDASGDRTMSAASGHAAITFLPAPGLTAWTSIATSFETPTTTELANRIEGDGGFNTDLDPQRSVSVEFGVRYGRGRLRGEGAIYRTAADDALIAFRENAGRTYFRNAGSTRTVGAEFGMAVALSPVLFARATWTHTNATFVDYRFVDGTTPVDLRGNHLAGIPRNVLRVGLQGTIGGVDVDIDHGWSGAMYADDRNAIMVDGWGAGVTGVRLRASAEREPYRIAPFIGMTNVFNREYVGSVTINGGFGRVFEPSAGRAVFVGIEVGWR